MHRGHTALIFCTSLFLLGGSIFLLAKETNNPSSPTSPTETDSPSLPSQEQEDTQENKNNKIPLFLSRSTAGVAEGGGAISTCDHSQTHDNDTYTIQATCILQEKLPELTTKEIVDLIRDDIETFTEIYQPFEPSFTYYGGQPVYKTPNTSLLNGSFETNQQLIQRAKQRKEVGFTKKELARYRASKLAFYVSDKDISRLSRCNTQNYTLALKTLDGKLLQPEESFNANRELSKVRGYCTGRGEKNFLFYGGVCGMTAQVFRTTLIHPTIETVKRRPHNERFVQYYGTDIGGDDAAIYEMSKQFEIKNSGTEDIYFKVQRGEGHNLLVAISPRNDYYVEITKHPIHALKIDLERILWKRENNTFSPLIGTNARREEGILDEVIDTDEEETIIKQDTFHSTYINKNYELR